MKYAIRSFERHDLKDSRVMVLLSSWFRSFYSKPPWDEYRICRKCKVLNDFSDLNTYSFREKLTHCPVCETILTPFWDTERTMLYLSQAMRNENFIGLWIIEKKKNEIVGWIWGYEISSIRNLSIQKSRNNLDDAPLFYIDVIGSAPMHRGNYGHLLKIFYKLAFIVKIKIIKKRSKQFDLLCSIFRMPIKALLYLKLLEDVYNKYKYLVTRTHEDANSVKKLLFFCGFREYQKDLVDPKRVFWINKL